MSSKKNDQTIKMAFTVRCKNIRDLGDAGDNDSFATYVVINNEKKRIRVTTLKQLKELREANNVADSVGDVDFLMGDPQMQKFLQTMGGHLEFALCRMSPKKENKRRIEFPANAFEGGTVKSE